MTQPKPHIGIQFVAKLPHEAIEDFARDIGHPNLIYHQYRRDDFGFYAGLEWLVPTAIVVYLAKPYFNSFLSEAGKDHYQLLRKALIKIAKRYIGKEAPVLQVMSAGGKGKVPSGKYSLVFSVVADLGFGTAVKLLIESDLEHPQVELATTVFLGFINAMHQGQADLLQIQGMESVRPSGGLLLVRYDQMSQRLVAVDPLPKRNEPGT